MPSRRKDSGFAVLLIFLMASMIAISLYIEIPRVAFQAQRQKEQMLMERGEQYKRAIGLFVRANKNTRWPASVDDLENFNGRHFLRRRYVDPLTGKDEWRLIHIQNGILQDSVTNKKSNANDQMKSQITGAVTELAPMGQTTTDGSQQVNMGLRRRASEGGASVGPDGQPIPGTVGATGVSGSFPGVPGQTGQPNGPSGATGNMLGVPNPLGASGATGPSGQINNLNSGFGVFGGGFGAPPPAPGVPPQGGGIGTSNTGINGQMQGQPNGQQGGIQINPAAQAAAAGLLQNLLTQPRPGGLQGVTGTAGAGVIMGSGIAGVGTTAKGDSIMSYADHTDFSEWEFIYDPIKYLAPKNPNSVGAAGIGTPAAQLGSTAGFSNPGTPIGTGPGGTQGAAAPMGIAGSFGAQPAPAGGAAGFGAGMGGGVGSGMGGVTSTMSAATATGTGGTSAGTGAGSGAAGGLGSPSSAFGQAGGPDIRPGKR